MKSDKEMFVQVSPLISKMWYDPASRMWFKPEDGIIPIPIGTDMTNIVRYLRLNYLKDKTPQDISEREVPPDDIVTYTAGQLLAKEEAIFKAALKEKEERDAMKIVIDVPEVPENIQIVIDESQDDNELPEITPPTNDPSGEPKEGGTELITQTDKVPCQYCGKEYSPKGIKTHERSCKLKPEE